MRIFMVEITAPSQAEAERLARALVEERLASCANLLGGMRSIYRWKGRVHEGKETLLLVKTVEAALPALVERVRSLHSYECPCVAAFPISGGNLDYLAWVAAECRPHGRDASQSGGPD